MKIVKMCRDYGPGGRPGCLGTPDPKYQMRFDDIGEEPVEFCAHCGPEAHAIDAALVEAFRQGGPQFIEKFARLLGVAVEHENKGMN